MSKVVLDTVQLGQSATATQNLVIKTNKDGSFTIARGNDGATTQDIVTITATGAVRLDNQPYYQGQFAGNSTAASNFVLTIANTVANRGFTVTGGNRVVFPHAGVYLVHAQQLATTTGATYFSLRKNGVVLQYAWLTTGMQQDMQVTGLVTAAAGDYIDIYYQGGPVATFASTHNGLSVIQVG